jgi:hypothetical protein
VIAGNAQHGQSSSGFEAPLLRAAPDLRLLKRRGLEVVAWEVQRALTYLSSHATPAPARDGGRDQPVQINA